MYNPALNKVCFGPEALMNVFVDENGENSYIPEDYHLSTILCWIRKYCIDRGYNKDKDILKIIKNITKLFNKFKFNSISEEDSILKSYLISAINRQITITLKFESFSHIFDIDVTFFIGINDEAQIKVSRTIYDEIHDGIYDMNNHSVSIRGVYRAFDSGLMIRKPFNFASLHSFLIDIVKNCNESIFEKISKKELIDKIKTYYAICKFYNLKDNLKDNYLNENGEIDIDEILSITLNNDNYDENAAFNLSASTDPVLPNALKFDTIEPIMIPIKDLENIISEIIIDSILYDSIDVATNIKNIGGKNVISDEIYSKSLDLLYKFISFYSSYIDELKEIDPDDTELKSIFQLADISKDDIYEKEFDEKEKSDIIEDNISFYDQYIQDKEENEIINKRIENDTDLANEYISNSIDKLIFDEENKNIDNEIKNNWINIFKDMNKRYNTNNFYSKFKLNNLENALNYSSANLALYASFDALYNLYDNENSEKYQKSINLYDNNYNQKINKMYSDIRKKYNISSNLKTVNNLYNNYVFPIKNKLYSVCENIDAINKSFNSLFSNSLLKKDNNENTGEN